MHCRLRNKKTYKSIGACRSNIDSDNGDSVMVIDNEENCGVHHSAALFDNGTSDVTSNVLLSPTNGCNDISEDDSNIIIANLARKLTKDVPGTKEISFDESNVCLASLAKMTKLKVNNVVVQSSTNHEKDVYVDSNICLAKLAGKSKFKTFKTYGKVKWKTRKLSSDWEVIKSVVGNNGFSVCKVDVKSDDNMVEDECEEDNPVDTVNRTPKSAKKITLNESLVTPSTQEIANGVGSPTKHSTPIPNSNKLFRTPPVSALDGIRDCSNLHESVGFHRTISFTPLQTISHQPCAISALLVPTPDRKTSGVKESPVLSRTLTIEEKILLLCEQSSCMNTYQYIKRHNFTKKIAEGSYGEVFERQNKIEGSIVVKIVPVGSPDVLVNGIPQMSLEEVMSEMVINKTLSGLKDVNPSYQTEGFVRLHKLVFCQGRYPPHLLKLWESWNSEHGSENDNPKMFNRDQMYIGFETDFCGIDLEHYKCKSGAVAFSILKQVVASLAVAEKLYQFEHRDLHWGNLLLMESSKPTVEFVIDSEKYVVETHGIIVSIIDFTVSRIREEGCVVFTDLKDEVDLFEGKGDAQFSIYRDMKSHNKNNWEAFNPYSNVLWVHYLVEKLITKLRFAIRLSQFMDRVKHYRSAYEILMLDRFWKE